MDIALIMDNHLKNGMGTEIMQGFIEMLRGFVIIRISLIALQEDLPVENIGGLQATTQFGFSLPCSRAKT